MPSALSIVTGAKNLSAGDTVPVALDGAVIADDKKITTTEFRGIKSEGMLCSLEELGLTLHDFPYADENGIFVVEEPCVPGDNALAAIGLDDTIVEFEITSNRRTAFRSSALRARRPPRSTNRCV
jgi:phenylalanyl-tRNA synthetase beta chain